MAKDENNVGVLPGALLLPAFKIASLTVLHLSLFPHTYTYIHVQRLHTYATFFSQTLLSEMQFLNATIIRGVVHGQIRKIQKKTT